MIKVIHIKDAPKDWQSNPDYVYIGRVGKGLSGYFGNPFKLNSSETRGSTLEKFENWARSRMATDKEYRMAILRLRNKTLICFCKPHPCHGDVLAKLAEEPIVMTNTASGVIYDDETEAIIKKLGE